MERIGRYEIVERLGAGGFATVYLAVDPVLDSRVAIKVLAENWSGKPELRERFIREAQLLRRIDSDRVITVHDIGELPSSQPYFVMALVDRGTLDERLAAVAAGAAADVQNVGTQLGACLRVIHGEDMIHRDIKPSNLLIAGPRGAVGPPGDGSVLAPSERIVLGDFGLAKDIALQSTVGFTISAGTGGYAAPEQMSPVGVPDRRTDLYAATGVMYRVITGETPPTFDLGSETVPFPEHERWMHTGVGAFFRRGMAFFPERRHNSIDGWLTDLQAAVESMSTGGLISGSNPTIPASTGDPLSPPPSGGSFTPDSWAPPTVQTDPRQHAQQPLRDPRSVPSVGAPLVPPAHQPAGSNAGTGHAQPAHGFQQHYPSQPVLQAAPPQTYQPTGVDPRSGQQRPVTYEDVRGSRGVGKWLALVAVIAALALGGLWYAVLRPVGPTVAGPATIEAGTTEVYRASFDGAASFEWTDWSGFTKTTDEFEVTAVAPGSLTFSVVGIDSGGSRSPATQHTITILDSPDGPRIVGPDTVRVGVKETFSFTGPEGSTDPEWIDGNPNEKRGDTYEVTPRQAGTFRVVLIVTLANGDRVGTAKEIEFVG